MKKKVKDALDLIFGHMLLIGIALMIGGFVVGFPKFEGMSEVAMLTGAMMTVIALMYAQFRGGDEG